MSVESIFNFKYISDRLASSGQPEDGEFRYIADDGYKSVINLAMPDSENAIPEEGNIVTAHGMSYYHIPVPFDAPSIEHLKKFISVMNAISHQKVWIHCVKNYRVSAILYQHYKLELQIPDKDASDVILKTWALNDVWKEFMSIDKHAMDNINEL